MDNWSEDLKRAEPALALLEQLCECVNVSFDQAQARRLLARDARGTGDWCSTVRRAGVTLGVAWRSFRASTKDAVKGVATRRPILLWVDPERPDGWALIMDRKIGSIFVATPSSPAGRWMKIAAFERETGQTGDTVWWAADPATPLEWLSGSGGKKAPLDRVFGLLRAEKEDFRVIMIFALGTGLLTLATPIAVQALVNNVAFGTLLQPVVILTFALVLGLALSSALTALEVYVVEILQRRLFVRVTGDLASRLPRVRVSSYDGYHGPELVNRYFDVFTVHKATATLLLDGLDLVLRTGVGLLLLAFYHPLLLAFDIVLVVALVFVLVILGRTGERTAVKESQAKYNVAAWLETIAARPSTFKHPAAQLLARDRVDHLAREFLLNRQQHFRIVFRQTIGSLAVQTIASAAVLGLGGWLVIRGQLTLGQLVAAELVVTAVVASFAKMGKQIESYYDLIAGVDKLGKLADLPMERYDGEQSRPAAATGATFEFGDLTIRPPKRGAVLKGGGMTIESGGRMAVCGAHAAGRSALADVLLGHRQPAEGWLRLNGTDYRDMSMNDLRRRIALASPDQTIPGTILENVVMGRLYIDNTEVRRVLGTVGLLETVSAFPAGLQTELTLDGQPLDQTELTMLMLARAAVGRPELLVVDGLLDALDPEALERALEGLLHPEGTWTLLVLTRRPDIAARFENQLYLRDATLRPLETAA